MPSKFYYLTFQRLGFSILSSRSSSVKGRNVSSFCRRTTAQVPVKKRLIPQVHSESMSGSGSSAGAASTNHQKTWNEASCVMAVAPMNNSEPYSLGFLLVERSGTGRVMPGNWVFPGGTFDAIDSDVEWISLFKKIGNIDITRNCILQDGAKIPEIYEKQGDDGAVQQSKATSTSVPKEISLRITAVREMFEEAGILLCRPGRIEKEKHCHTNGMLHYEFPELDDKTVMQEWQKKVRKSSASFIEMCKELNCVPDIYALYEWSNWLSPTFFKAKVRFDTMNFMIILPRMPKVVIDGNEAVNAQWTSPTTVVDEHQKGQLRLMPPQLYEMSRLKTIKTFTELEDRLNIRRKLGIERFFPVFKKASDATLAILPGDEMYPATPEYMGSQVAIEEIPKTVAQLKETGKHFHRGISNTDGVITKFDVNVTRFGHIY